MSIRRQRLLAASSFDRRTCANVFSALKSVCSGLQDSNEVDRSATQLRFGDFECLLRTRDDLSLKPLLKREFLQRDERLLGIGKCRQNGFAISLQVLQLHALCVLQLALKEKAVEDRLSRAGPACLEPCARRE